MNFDAFVSALSAEEVETLSSALYARRVQDVNFVSLPKVSEEELCLVQARQFLDAIKTYRDRTGLSLLEAKVVIDDARGRK